MEQLGRKRGKATASFRSGPRLLRVDIEGFRSCARTSFRLNPDLSALIGANGAGKTNILQAITLLGRAVSPPLNTREPVGLTQQCRISAEFKVRRQQLGLRFVVQYSLDDESREVIHSVRRQWRRGGIGARSSRDWNELPEYGYWHWQRRLHSSRVNSEHRDLFETVRLNSEFTALPSSLAEVLLYLSSATYYSASRFTDPSQCPSSFEVDEKLSPVRSVLKRNHTQFLSDLYRCKMQTPQLWASFEGTVGKRGLGLIDAVSWQEVKVASSQVEVKSGGKIVREKRQRRLIVPSVRVGDDRLSFSQLSEGTFRTLALVFYLLTNQSRLLLIEEPEVCVHHGLLASVVELIKAQSGLRQVVFSTHSDFVLDQLEPEHVFGVTRTSKGTTVQALADAPAKTIAALRLYLNTAGNLGDYWRQGGFNL